MATWHDLTTHETTYLPKPGFTLTVLAPSITSVAMFPTTTGQVVLTILLRLADGPAIAEVVVDSEECAMRVLARLAEAGGVHEVRLLILS